MSTPLAAPEAAVTPTVSTRRTTLWSALVGVVAAASTLAVAELFSLLMAPLASPVLAVGSLVIDLVPAWLKTLVIDLFGTGDKIVLLGTLGLVVLVLAALVGVLEFRRTPFGIVLLALVGLIAVIAVTTREESTIIWAFPTVFGMIAGVITLRVSTNRLHEWLDKKPVRMESAYRNAVDRRGFLTVLIGVGAASVVVGIGARVMNAGTAAVTAIREAIQLPSPSVTAAAIPAGAELDIDGISPLVSSNADFYRIDTALQVPSVDADRWVLKITGMVENEIEVTFAELLALPLIETYVTLMCVSNEVGGSLAGNAKWLGYPIRELLARAKPTGGADMVMSTSVDGFTASTPLEVLQDENRDSILAVGMNGEALPLEHGFPVRMVVPGLFGYVSATKWVKQLHVTTFAESEGAYWTQRGWSDHGPVKTSSRIDVPANGRTIAAGKVAVAGMAWAQHTGITGVEVRVDKGDWKAAQLAEAISADTWRQWVYEWDADEGDHTLEVRATDATGFTQSETRRAVVPDGSEGWHTVEVSVS